MTSPRFEDFLQTVALTSQGFALRMDAFLLKNGCQRQVKEAKSGFTVSYLHGAGKNTLATFICRKTGVKLRIYPEHLGEYEAFLSTLPEKLKQEIKKASVCKRLVDPEACNPKCAMGYHFYMDGEAYKRCRYMAFQPTLNEENNPYIEAFLQQELTRIQ